MQNRYTLQSQVIGNFLKSHFPIGGDSPAQISFLLYVAFRNLLTISLFSQFQVAFQAFGDPRWLTISNFVLDWPPFVADGLSGR